MIDFRAARCSLSDHFAARRTITRCAGGDVLVLKPGGSVTANAVHPLTSTAYGTSVVFAPLLVIARGPVFAIAVDA